MEPEEQDIDKWARQLAGDKSGSDALDPEVATLREVVLENDKRIAAETAANEVLRARLMKRLESEGLLAGAAKSQPAKRAAWNQWVSAAAAVLVVAFGLFTLLPFGIEQPVDRGITGSVVVVSADPENAAQAVVRELQTLGLQPTRSSIDGRVVVDVQVNQEQLAAFSEWAAARKARAVTQGKYRVFFDPAP